MNLLTPTTAEHWAEARRLVEEYARSLAIDLGFQDFLHEVESLTVEYGPPLGALLLAEHEGRFVGCGGFRHLHGHSASATVGAPDQASSPGTAHPAPPPGSPHPVPALSTQYPVLSTRNVCEMKRLYVAPEGRGFGIGRALAATLIDQARARGYTSMRLDTLPTMHAARHIYAALGFRDIASYRYNPVEGTAFMELDL